MQRTARSYLTAALAASLPLLLGAGSGSGGEAAPGVEAPTPNGFTLSNSRVPVAEIIAGGPPRDGILSVDEPRFAKPEDASWVRGDTPVIGVAVGEIARAYPVHVMEYHQVVNDVYGETPVVVTYDPLTDAGIAYVAKHDETALTFGVSGLVYASGFLLYDRESESLWSQFLGRALTGAKAGASLERLPTRVEPMAQWYARHPESLILERPKRFEIDYRVSRYSAYWISEKVPFPVRARDDRFHPKELVLGVVGAGRSRVYLASIVSRAGSRIVDEIAGEKIRIAYDGETGTFAWDAPAGLAVTSAYWFAWKSFHPDTEVWNEPADPARPAPSP